MTSNLTLGAVFTGLGNQWAYNPPVLQNISSPGEQIPTLTANGNITLTPPTGALGIIIVPPTSSIITKTLKGLAGDQGIPINTANWSVLSLPPNSAAIVLAANGIETLGIYWF